MSQKKAVSDNQNLPLIAENRQIYLWKARAKHPQSTSLPSDKTRL
jgi:hypothetical protein